MRKLLDAVVAMFILYAEMTIPKETFLSPEDVARRKAILPDPMNEKCRKYSLSG